MEKWYKRIHRSIVHDKRIISSNSEDINFDFLLELHQKQQGRCFYSGLQMECNTEIKSPFRISLDRMDSSIGYTKKNVVLCCCFLNYMKSNFDMEIFKNFLQKIKAT